jgi:hypothetical protein
MNNNDAPEFGRYRFPPSKVQEALDEFERICEQSDREMLSKPPWVDRQRQTPGERRDAINALCWAVSMIVIMALIGFTVAQALRLPW